MMVLPEKFSTSRKELNIDNFSSKTIISFSYTLFLPDIYSGPDFRLSVNATGLLRNSILPVVTLYIVLHVVFVVAKRL